MQVGQRINETGVVGTDAVGYFLRRSLGGRLRLDLRRVADARMHDEVRVIGTYVGADLIDVDSLTPVEGDDQASAA